jgi:hypothetical protein
MLNIYAKVYYVIQTKLFFYELIGRKIEVLGEFLVEVWGCQVFTKSN